MPAAPAKTQPTASSSVSVTVSGGSATTVASVSDPLLEPTPSTAAVIAASVPEGMAHERQPAVAAAADALGSAWPPQLQPTVSSR